MLTKCNGVRMKRSYINKVSDKQKVEIQKRKDLKAELMKTWNGICPDCNERPDFRGVCLIHKKSLAQGGQTDALNTYLGCFKCHNRKYHGIKEV